MNYIDIQNEVVKKYRIDLCDGTRCSDGDWSRTHAHVKKRRVCKWKQANSVQSTFTLFHEIGHIETTKGGMRRAEEEYHATVWAMKECAKYGIQIPQKTIDDYQEYIDDEVARGKRRGGTAYGNLKLPDPKCLTYPQGKAYNSRHPENKVDETMKLTQKITERRKALGLTQQQLADKLGWGLRKLTSYERNERIPPLTEALELAEALKSKVEDLWEKKKEG